MDKNGDTKTLQTMFSELTSCQPVERKSYSSFNDGGNVVEIIWEGPDQHWQTVHNDWSIVHPDTSISKVNRVEERKWVNKISQTKKYKRSG